MTPSYWNRCVDVESIYQIGEVKTVEISGFTDLSWNGVYAESTEHERHGKPIWWKSDGEFFIHWCASMSLWCHSPRFLFTSDQLNGKDIIGSRARCPTAPDVTDGVWREYVDDVGFRQVSVARLSPAPKRVPLFMHNVVDTWQSEEALSRFTQLLKATMTHDTPEPEESRCNEMKAKLRVVRVLRIENWHLWVKYNSRIQQMKSEMCKHGIRSVDPLPVPDALRGFPQHYGGTDASVNESFLFHGTSFTAAV